MTKQLLALLILIAIIALSAGAPIASDSNQQESAPASTNDDTAGKLWSILRDNVLFPTIKLVINDDTKNDKPDFKSASAIENSSTNSTTTTAAVESIEPPKFFAYLDTVVYEIANLTFLGYIYIGVLVILLLVILCCTGCCCCCGCCRCR